MWRRGRENEPLSVLVVVILGEERSDATAELPTILDSALLEVLAFYNYDKTRISVGARFYYTRVSAGKKTIDEDNPDFHPIEGAVVEKARGKYLGLYDQWKLVKIIRKQVGYKHRNGKLLIITDMEITPPPEWRYILWDMEENNAVISLAAMNPEYWGLRERNVLATIKHRSRTSCINVIGRFLGLQLCYNPKCFLRADVDSATTLDEMVSLGEEHELKELANLGFSPRPPEPRKIQSIQAYPGRPLRQPNELSTSRRD